MPIYEYRCKKCGKDDEVFARRIIHENEKTCEKCGGKMKRRFSHGISAKFIGAGFYCNDCKVDPNRDPKIPTPVKDLKEKLG